MNCYLPPYHVWSQNDNGFFTEDGIYFVVQKFDKNNFMDIITSKRKISYSSIYLFVSYLMKNVFHHHIKKLHKHINKHKHKYLFGIFWGYAVVKLFLLLLWVSVVEYTRSSTFAQLESGCVLTGQYYTWEYLTGQELTWWYSECTTVEGYFTWGTLDESGTLIGATRVDPVETCVLTWQELSAWYLTWGYRTWGYITWCLENTGIIQTWTNETWTNETWTNQPWTISLTWMNMFTSWSTPWYLNISGVVVLNFTANQLLSGLQVTLSSGKIPTSSSVSGLLYTYTRIVSSWYTEGPLVASISFVGVTWNIVTTLYTWSLIFDKTFPVVDSFVFSWTTGWLYLNFSWSEPVRYTIDYWKTGSDLVSGFNVEYLTAQQFMFSWIESAQIYMFTMDIYDRAGNMREVTGDVLQTTLWTILSHIYIIPLETTIQEAELSWNLSTLAVILKAEVEKFNMCKDALSYTPIELSVRNNTFSLHMPMFEKSQMKTLVNAFTLFVLDKVKRNYSMTSDDISEITKKFDNFLIILKLLRDDDNECKQNLSNYHITQFKKTLEEYNLNNFK